MFFRKIWVCFFSLVIPLNPAVSPLYAQLEVIDCVAAHVNQRVLTLTDLRILQAFGIYEKELGEEASDRLLPILERAIDQRVVIDLARQNISVTKDESDAQLRDIADKFGDEALEERLRKFGLTIEDLRTYLEEKMLYQKIIDIRFTQSASVSLREIETYYSEVYVPSQLAKGEDPRAMIELLDEIESWIKEEKSATQISSWIKSLYSQADVSINEDCLRQIDR